MSQTSVLASTFGAGSTSKFLIGLSWLADEWSMPAGVLGGDRSTE